MVTIDRDDLEESWIHGQPRGSTAADPVVQVRSMGDATFVIRQSKSIAFEAPFLYLLVGAEQALLLDTGAVASAEACDVRGVVDDLLPAGIPLVVAHTHGHGDHVAGDGQFADRPDTVVVGRDVASARAGWGFTGGTDEVTTFDLGGRMLEVTGIPGHHPTAVAVHDPLTETLFTGDSVYPGRLYASDAAVFAASTERLLDFAAARPVRRVLGCHVEMRRTGGDYPMGSRYQPDEASLVLTPEDLARIGQGVRSAGARPGVHDLGGALLWNGSCRLALARQLARLTVERLSGRA